MMTLVKGISIGSITISFTGMVVLKKFVCLKNEVVKLMVISKSEGKKVNMASHESRLFLMINSPCVAGAVLLTPLSLID